MNIFGSSTASTIMGSVATSTTSYIVVFAPIFEIMAGIILAVFLITAIIGFFSHRGQGVDFDDILPDDMI